MGFGHKCPVIKYTIHVVCHGLFSEGNILFKVKGGIECSKKKWDAYSENFAKKKE